ncbi:MAG TPA: DCC1-like thiol-disulfide oxidoreductase family protein [Bacteroidia bacterium]|nr:DCC1-like thiol-disulfide oxidoreductase family protein [Bacteroidia bacterium]HNU33443.1 DCC1-like thiol-disulfide oxidoreductase family protein [Bacteroidia bacterium]
MSSSTKSIVLFDGNCNYCTRTVLWTIKRDVKNKLLFSATQVDAGKKILKEYGIENLKDTSVILIEDNKVYLKSDAVLNIARRLPNYKFFYPLIFLPRFIRDGIYNIIAKNRYRWFGKRDMCYLPDEDVRERFL